MCCFIIISLFNLSLHVSLHVSLSLSLSLSLQVLCSRVTGSIHLIDPLNLKKAEITSDKYFKQPFTPLFTKKNFKEFTILDINPVEYISSGTSTIFSSRGENSLCDVEVCLSDDFSTTYNIRSHLGNICKC